MLKAGDDQENDGFYSVKKSTPYVELEEMRDKQRSDEVLGAGLRWKEAGIERPPEAEVLKPSPVVH